MATRGDVEAEGEIVKLQYRIARAAPHDVEPDVLRIWRGSLPVEGDGGDRFRWTYDEAPEPARDLYLLVAEGCTRAQLVGTAGVQIRSFSSTGRKLRVGLGSNLAVDEPHRTVLPALRLIRELQRSTRSDFDLTYHVPNDHARGLYERAGFHDLGQMIRHVAILRHAPYVRRVVPSRLVAGAAGSALDAVQGARRACAARRVERELRLEWLPDADARFDQLWRNASAEYPLLSVRDASWLRWRYLKHPGCHCELAALTERRPDGALRGYAVLEEDGDVIHVRDVFARLADLGALFALLLPAVRDRRATTISFAYLGRREIVDVLAAHGFRPRGPKHHVYADAGDRLSDVERARVLDPATWFLTDFDKDN